MGGMLANPTTITLYGAEFSAGYHAGYLAYLDTYKGKDFSEKHLHDVLCNTLLNVQQTDSYNTGYSTGFITALHTDRPLPIQVAGQWEI